MKIGKRQRDAIRVDCTCGMHLAYYAKRDGEWRNVDHRPQPLSGPRVWLDEYDNVHARCTQCPATPKVKRAKLHEALDAVAAAGLRYMRFRSLPGGRGGS